MSKQLSSSAKDNDHKYRLGAQFKSQQCANDIRALKNKIVVVQMQFNQSIKFTVKRNALPMRFGGVVASLLNKVEID